ncbi:glutamate-5-semialdehyde dehydrogenase [Hyphococcus lacteus]|uniref:Gamma-glutamyl phosphate reductase n=1 Tax=Hyphococcus lacteus TaxID=3143536 RepID=A0ABV3Z4Z1_9PROT
MKIDKVEDYMETLAQSAREAARAMATIPSDKKNEALLKAAENILANAGDILRVNKFECDAAIKRGQDAAFIDRMSLSQDRIAGIAQALREIASLDDPVGKSIRTWSRPNGLEFERVRTPIGVIAIIYESRPNVTVDAAAIAVKAGNAVILRGGSECIETSKALFDCFQNALRECGLPEAAAQFVETTDRAAVGAILSGMNGRIDLVIPRGGKSLVGRVQSEARAPVLSHLDGICHVYVDGEADHEKAVAITLNAKMRRTGVCGAAETLLIDKACIAEIWPAIAEVLRDADCELRGDAALVAIDPSVSPATEIDWSTEYLAPILSVAVVDGVEGAIAHIAKYSSGHTEAIITENEVTAARFLSAVDSAIVMHNASTQFADGGEFGFGGEIGIATGRLHARGPAGVEELTTYKNLVRGTAHVRP